MNTEKNFKFNVNGFMIEATYQEDTINNLLIPLLEKWTIMQAQKNKRLLIFLAAPPAVGKSTLACFLEYLSLTIQGIKPLQALGLDGFHYSQNYIHNHVVNVHGKVVPMVDVKGCPETFDIDKLNTKLQNLMLDDVKWPIYDRSIHDVIEDSIQVEKDIVLIEGNWLLYKDAEWKTLKNYCDFSVFIYADELCLRKRLIDRKRKGGLSYEEATAFYEKSDSKNIQRVLNNSFAGDIELIMQENGNYQRK